MRDDQVDKAAAFNLMRVLGIAIARVYFSGGNDEGGVDAINVVAQDGDTFDLSPYGEEGDKGALVELLGRPVYAEYGGFNDEPYVDGVLTWSLGAGTVKMTGDEQYTESREMAEKEF